MRLDPFVSWWWVLTAFNCGVLLTLGVTTMRSDERFERLLSLLALATLAGTLYAVVR